MLCCLGGECDGTSSLSRKASKFSPPFVTNETSRQKEARQFGKNNRAEELVAVIDRNDMTLSPR